MNKQNLINTLNEQFINCTRCPLGTQGRNRVVFGTGNLDAQIFFVGEGPGRDEDAQGKPFIGRAGQLLNKIIEAMKFKREDVYISNVVKCRPPNNRVPTEIEAGTCKTILLFKEIEIIRPDVIITLGATAAQAIFGPETKLSHIRGRFQYFRQFPVLPTFHPAYLLRNPSQKRTVWADMQHVIKFISELKNIPK